jgi:hypothetical protein
VLFIICPPVKNQRPTCNLDMTESKPGVWSPRS